MQLLLYAPAISPRLQYSCSFIFEELIGVNLTITTVMDDLIAFREAKINYSDKVVAPDCFSIGRHNLLFENDIRQTDVDCFMVNNYKAFFKTDKADFPFDILAASFYLLSRYEEYLPHENDMYGRYAHENSLAFREGFLHLPLINIWVKHLLELLQKKFPASMPLQAAATFSFLPTYDIDMAFSYKYKGWLRNAGGFIKSPSFKRIKVLLGLQKDPFDAFGWLDQLHNDYSLHPIYFFLMAEQNSVYDKNILPHKKVMWKLIRSLAKKYTTGIHPSWQSGDDDKPALLDAEKSLLETITEKAVTHSRQHYIRFNLPEGYRRLLSHGVEEDYSMGYGSINGFRASTASSFFWFDLPKNESTSIRIHPFCFMEANSFYEQKNTAAEAYSELMEYYKICKAVNGRLITIWHNNFLGTEPQFGEWKDIYSKFIRQISSDSSPGRF